MKAGMFLWSCALGLVAGSTAFAEPRSESATYGTRLSNLPLPISLETLPAVTRDTLAKVMKSPTITAVAPAEEFVAHSDMYQWLLDHPDRTSQAWNKLGVTAATIKPLKDGRFLWKDENGSEVVWQTIGVGPTGRIWYAEGKVKPAALSPSFPVQAVAVLTHSEKPRAAGGATITQQVEVFLSTDSKAANLVMKVLGDNAPKMAQNGAGQVLMFFSGIAKYTHDKPEKTVTLFEEKK
jgi:hypothetical protein